jgi:hypothetical protein
MYYKEIVHKSCPIRYDIDGEDYCGASETPCEYCVEKKGGVKMKKGKNRRRPYAYEKEDYNE